MIRWWAFWRRIQYLTGLSIFLTLIFTGVYFLYFFTSPSCFDGIQNNAERAIDCGGTCTRVCAFDVIQPKPLWTRSFEIKDGEYNSVSYIENKNFNIGTPEIGYTLSLYDDEGLIVERSGVTILPPDSVSPIFEGNINTGSRVPTKTFIELSDAELWLPSKSSRDHFIIEERKLSSVDGRPRLDVSITNTAITEAEDVEVVVTIFDKNGNALTVSRTIVPRFLGKETKDVVFTWPLPIAKTLKSCEVQTDVVLAIDLSGSMNDDSNNPPEPITSVLTAARTFVDSLREGDQVGVVTFATNALLANRLSANTNAVGDVVSGLNISPSNETGSTNTGDAIIFAKDELLSERHSLNARKVVVLLTDGLANAPDDNPEDYAISAAKSLKSAGAEVFTIGLGNSVNEVFLKEIASDANHYYPAASASIIDSIYQSITTSICEDGPAVIDIVPKTKTSFEQLQ